MYKETELADTFFDSPEIPAIFQRIRHHLACSVLKDFYDDPDAIQWLPCHAIDLKKEDWMHIWIPSSFREIW